MLSRKAYLNYIGTSLPSKSITGFEHVILKTRNRKQETYNIGIPIKICLGISPFFDLCNYYNYLTTIPTEFLLCLFSLD